MTNNSDLKFHDDEIYETLNKLVEEVGDLKSLTLKKEKPFMDIRELADYPGISRHTLYGYSSRRIIPRKLVQPMKTFLL